MAGSRQSPHQRAEGTPGQRSDTLRVMIRGPVMAGTGPSPPMSGFRKLPFCATAQSGSFRPDSDLPAVSELPNYKQNQRASYRSFGRTGPNEHALQHHNVLARFGGLSFLCVWPDADLASRCPFNETCHFVQPHNPAAFDPEATFGSHSILR